MSFTDRPREYSCAPLCGALFLPVSASVCYWHYAADPFFNMAFDDAMLGQVLHNPQCRFFRLYTWAPGTITIGVNQKPEKAVCLERLGKTPLIRRSTGGRAVYHDVSELTYSIALDCGQLALPCQGESLSAVYLRLSRGLQSFLTELGISAQIVRRSGIDSGQEGQASVRSCFASTARYELVADGKKILAAAQRRVRTAILQHGSIKINGVAPHPALPDLVPGDSWNAQPLDRSRLEVLAMSFGRSFSGFFGDSDFTVSDSSYPFPELRQRVASLRENPLSKRDLN